MCVPVHSISRTVPLISCTDVKGLFERAHELANLANRSGPIVTDLLLACEEQDVDPEQLRKVVPGPRSKRRKSSGVRLMFVPLGTRLTIVPQIHTTSRLLSWCYLNLHLLCHA